MFPSTPQSSQPFYLASELLAYNVARLFPNVILAGGGVNSLGFYYDFIFDQHLTENAFELIDVELFRFVKDNHPVRSISMMRENAQTLFEHHGQLLLADLAMQKDSNIIDLVQIHDFYGLCPCLGLTQTQELGQVKLLNFSEFKKDVEGEEIAITRIVGTVQESARDLKAFVKKYEGLLKKQDHRFLGPALNLFSVSSAGLLGFVWHPKGLQLKETLVAWMKSQLIEDQLDEVSTPIAGLSHFLGFDPLELESFDFEGESYRLRSSFLPQHLEYLKKRSLQKEELPYRIHEWASIFSYVPEPKRWGLFSACVEWGEQTTICCLKEQVVFEVISSLHFIEQIIRIFGFEARWVLVGSRSKASKSELERETIALLKEAVEAPERFFPYSSELEEKEGEVDPYLSLMVKDRLGREWSISRVAVISSWKRDVLTEDHEQTVIVIRQIWESLDRFIALLIEHHEGRFPFWLAPEQVRVVAIGEKNRDYAKQVSQTLLREGLRVKLDLRSSPLSTRVHQGEKEKIPYLILVGEQERIKRAINVRAEGKNNHHRTIDIETFLQEIRSIERSNEIRERKKA